MGPASRREVQGTALSQRRDFDVRGYAGLEECAAHCPRPAQSQIIVVPAAPGSVSVPDDDNAQRRQASQLHSQASDASCHGITQMGFVSTEMQ